MNSTETTWQQTRELINQNALQFVKLEAEFNRLGFTSYRAIARVIHDLTGAPYLPVYRALLYIDNASKYTALMEETIAKLKEE